MEPHVKQKDKETWRHGDKENQGHARNLNLLVSPNPCLLVWRDGKCRLPDRLITVARPWSGYAGCGGTRKIRLISKARRGLGQENRSVGSDSQCYGCTGKISIRRRQMVPPRPIPLPCRAYTLRQAAK